MFERIIACFAAEKEKFVYNTLPKKYLDVLKRISPYWGFKYFAGDEEANNYNYPAIYFDGEMFCVVGPGVEITCPTLAHAMIEYESRFSKQCAAAEANLRKKIKSSEEEFELFLLIF